MKEKEILSNFLLKSFSALLANFNFGHTYLQMKGRTPLSSSFSPQDFHKRKGVCKSPRIIAVTMHDEKIIGHSFTQQVLSSSPTGQTLQERMA